MKFISKNVNLRVVLRPGIPAEPITGRQPVAGLYAKFENGSLISNDETTIELLKKHPGFGPDYIMVEDGGVDPYKDTRKESEPEHSIQQIDYGHVGKSLTPKSGVKFTKEQKIAIEKMFKDGVKEEALKLVQSMLANKSPELPEEKKPEVLKENNAKEEKSK
jgi:hypothetical protein